MTGHLGLPTATQPTPGQTIIFEAIPTHIYFGFAANIPASKSTKERLLADDRFRSIDGKMLDSGNGAGLLNVDNLVAWWTYRANEVGLERANKELDHFLDSPTKEALAVLWIYGVTAKARVQLSEGVELVPIAEMPLSQEKYDFQRLTFTHAPHQLPPPQAALVKMITLPKIATNDRPTAEVAFATLSQLHKISFLMNALSGTCSMPGYQTFYDLPGSPLGPFGGSGGGSVLFDMLPHRQFEFNPEHSDLLSNLAQRYDQLNGPSKTRIESALLRFAQAKGRLNPGDVCLDLGIALEMVLLNTEHENQEMPGQLTLHFRLRGSWLLGRNKEERRDIYRALGKIYALRSKIAHNGFSNELFRMPYAERQVMLANHISIGERILQHLILNGTPADWASLTLGS